MASATTNTSSTPQASATAAVRGAVCLAGRRAELAGRDNDRCLCQHGSIGVQGAQHGAAATASWWMPMQAVPLPHWHSIARSHLSRSSACLQASSISWLVVPWCLNSALITRSFSSLHYRWVPAAGASAEGATGMPWLAGCMWAGFPPHPHHLCSLTWTAFSACLLAG